MSRSESIVFLQSEIAEITRQLAEIGSEPSIERPGLSSRLEETREELERLQEINGHLASAELTFSGLPVIGTRALRADFASSALEAYEKAVIGLAGSLTRGSLSRTARLPGRGQNQLFITSLARGSLGFQLEEMPSAEEASGGDDRTVLAQALDRIQNILEASTAEDEKLAESIVEVDARVVSLLCNFTEVLARNGARCAVRIGPRRVSFGDDGQVLRALERLSSDNVKQETKTMTGTLVGVLPTPRQFEMQIDDGRILLGRIDQSLEIVDVKLLENHRVRTEVKITSVGRSDHAAMRGLMLKVEGGAEES